MRGRRFMAVVGITAASIAACVEDSGTNVVEGSGADSSVPSDADVVGDSGGSNTGGDAGTDSSMANGGGDAGADADAGAACDPTKPFGPPVLLAGSGINVTSQASPHLTADEKTLVFYQTVDGGDHIFQATRPDLSSPFAAPIVQSALDHAQFNNDPDLSADGTSIFFSSSDNGGEGEIYLAKRNSLSTAWNAPALVANIHVAGSSDFHAFITADAGELWLSSTRPNGSGAGDIWRASSNGAGGFSTPVNETELNTAQNDYLPVLSPDGLTIFWSSDRTDNGSKGGYDVWTAHRATTSAPFTSITNVSELNTSGTEYVNWISPDGCRLYMYRPQRMYVATRPH